MAKQASDKTIIKNLSRELRRETERARTAFNAQALLRERALAAEREVVEWKRRFDALLERTPAHSGAPEGH